MRQLMIQVNDGQGSNVADMLEQHHGMNIWQIKARNQDGPIDVVIADIPNNEIEGLINALESTQKPRITLIPTEVIALQPPSEEVSEQTVTITPRSPLEVYLMGLQSIGAWRSFLGYAGLAGVVVWTGLYTNTIFLLVAAMLLAPFASPAMNIAIATARGDIHLLWSGLKRYFASLGVTVAVTTLLSLILRQTSATTLMVDTVNISAVAVLLPLAAGAAGALNLVQSRHNSLVSGSAVGVLIAASLAPPTGVLGMAIAIGRWDMVDNALFLLLLQLVGINLTGAIIFWLYGLRSKGAYYQRGKRSIVYGAVVASAIILSALLAWQLWLSPMPEYQRSSIAADAAAQVRTLLDQREEAAAVEVNARFTRANVSDQTSLLVDVYIQPMNTVLSDAELREQIATQIQETLAQEFNVTPLVNVVIVHPPD